MNVILSPSHTTAGLGDVVNVAVYDVLTSTVWMLEIRAASGTSHVIEFVIDTSLLNEVVIVTDPAGGV